ncbi:MAG: hypothetical protein J1E81_02455 [Eubacterium sp.]|nr:hypothetical protein [Eubacterium sp.]
METFKIIVLVICLIAYTGFAVWAVTKFNKVSTGIAGSLCLAGGSVGVYFAAPFIAVALVWLLKAALIIGLIILVLSILGG